jgi:EAL domain-containing protein (putative c-di-GMP-specific phosphodiesterase class I)
MSVNVSGREVGTEQLRTSVLDALTSAGVSPSALMLELTETALLDAGSEQIFQLAELRDLGVHVGIDDFGTGYTSLQYLRNLPVTFVKVDRSFVVAVPDSPTDRAIVGALATLTKELGLYCIAEGVETEAHREAIQALGVEHLQGYLLCRPLPANDLTGRLQDTLGQIDVPRQRRPMAGIVAS